VWLTPCSQRQQGGIQLALTYDRRQPEWQGGKDQTGNVTENIRSIVQEQTAKIGFGRLPALGGVTSVSARLTEFTFKRVFPTIFIPSFSYHFCRLPAVFNTGNRIFKES